MVIMVGYWNIDYEPQTIGLIITIPDKALKTIDCKYTVKNLNEKNIKD